MDYNIIRKIFRDALRIDRLAYPRADLLTVAHDNDRSYLHEGRYYSPLIDTLEDDVRLAGGRCTSIARIASSIKGDKAYGDVRSPEGAFARALLQKRLLGVIRRGRYPYSKAEERVWGAILSETGARSVVAIQPSRELCKVCHERGIWVADMQHGVIAEQHPWYGEKFRATDPIDQLPNAFLCWDTGSADVIRQWANPRIETPVIGNPWLTRFIRKRPQDTLVAAVESQVSDLPHDSRKTILLTLSWGETDIPNGFIAEQLEAVIRRTSDRFRWLIRLHPNQVSGFATDEGPRFLSYFERALKGHAEWKWATYAPLPYLMSNVDVHISWTSSVSIEAALTGIKTGLLSPKLLPGQSMDNYYSYFRSTGYIELVKLREDEILSWINQACELGRRPQILDESETAYNNIVQRIVELRREN